MAVSPSHSAKNEISSPLRNSSTTTSVPAAPNPPPNIMSIAASAASTVWRHHDALAERKAVRLDDDRRALRPHVGLGGRGSREALVGGGRNAVRPAEILGEALRAFQARGRLGGPEGLEPGRLDVVDDARDQRIVGPDHDEVDRVRPAERDHGAVVGDVERHALGLARDPGIARRAPQPVAQRAAGDLPGQRMLAPARAEEENFHARPCRDQETRSM